MHKLVGVLDSKYFSTVIIEMEVHDIVRIDIDTG